MVLAEFQKMFDGKVVPYIENLGTDGELLNPMFYTLRGKSNKFRSATALLAGRICGGSDCDILPIAVASEIIHNSIIIQDDIADNGHIRRGKEVAWKKYGTCHALYSSVYSIPICLRILSGLKSSFADEINRRFLTEYQYVCKSQIDQSLLELSEDIPYERFLDIHMGKTAIGRWAITAPALFYGDEEKAVIFDQFARKLGDAGSIKNDIEDFLKDGGYESFCLDIRSGNLTYPIYYYFSMCDRQEQAEFIRIFGRNKSIDYYEIREKIMNKDTVLYAVEKINKLVAEAIEVLRDIPSSREKQLLIAWANNHNCLTKGTA